MAGVAPVNNTPNFKQQPEVRTQTRQFVQQALEQRQPQAAGQIDQNKLSDELLDEIGKAGVVDPSAAGGNLDSLLGALGQNFMDQKVGQAEAGAGAQEQSKEPKKEKIVDWTPKVRKGEIIGAHAPIGDVVVRERTVGGAEEGQKGKQPQGKAGQAAGKVGGVGKATGAAAPAGKSGAAPAVGPKPPADQNNEDKDDKGTDTVNLSPESQQMAQKLQGQGAQVPGVTDNQKSSGDSKNQSGEKIVQQGEITTRCGGVSQTIDVEGAGRLGEGSFLRVYKKLDDMPDDLMVGFKNKTGEEAVEDYNKKLHKGEVSKPLTANQLEQLRFPTGGQK